jgi:peptide/nickel transport system substrate-binding protein
MTITVGTNSESAMRLRITEMFAEDLSQCGIPVVRYDLPAGTWFYPGSQGPVFGRRFDLASLAWLGHIAPACDRFTRDNIPGWEEAGYAGWSGSNITGWSDEAYDVACQTAVDALPGSEPYDQNIGAAIAIFNEQLPVLPLFTDFRAVALRPGVKNVAPDPTQPSALWNIGEWQYAE